MGKISEELNEISSMEENTEKLYSIFKSINDYDLPIIRFYLGKGTALIRQRVNKKGEYFDHVSNLYYPPYMDITCYGRANLPFQSMFYGCTFPSDVDAPYPRIITLMETSSFFRDTGASGIERATCSKWILKDKVELIVLPFYEHYDKACNDIKEIQRLWNIEMQNTTINLDAKELIDYMSYEISKDITNNIDYFKIANFVNYLLYVNKKTKNADGIMYPSVPAKGNGFNVVLKTQSVDDKLTFSGASLCYLAKKEKQSYLMITNHSSNIDGDGYITYSDKIITKEENKMFNDIANNQNFIN